VASGAQHWLRNTRRCCFCRNRLAPVKFLAQRIRCTPYFRNKRRDAVFVKNEPVCNLPFFSLYLFLPQ
jgi:hypothetical protein